MRRRGPARRRCPSLCRLPYPGSAREWGFAIYRASHDDDYQDSLLPTGFTNATPGIPAETAARRSRAGIPELVRHRNSGPRPWK